MYICVCVCVLEGGQGRSLTVPWLKWGMGDFQLTRPWFLHPIWWLCVEANSEVSFLCFCHKFVKTKIPICMVQGTLSRWTLLSWLRNFLLPSSGNPKVLQSLHRSLSLGPIRGQLGPVHTNMPYLSKVSFWYYVSCKPKWSLLLRFSHQDSC
jgi:hypothetical protein